MNRRLEYAPFIMRSDMAEGFVGTTSCTDAAPEDGAARIEEGGTSPSLEDGTTGLCTEGDWISSSSNISSGGWHLPLLSAGSPQQYTLGAQPRRRKWLHQQPFQ